MDPRVEAYARLLVERCIDPKPGWQVLVCTTTEARPLARELSRQLALREAYALPRITFGAAAPVDADWIGAAPPELARHLAPLEQEVVDRVDAGIFALAPEDPGPDVAFGPEQQRAMRAHFSAYRRRGRAGEMPEVRCDFPCAAYAAWAGMSLAAYEDLFYAACLRDWDEEGRRMAPVLARFDRTEEVRIAGPGTDFKLSLADRTGQIDDGHQNVPGGEVFYSPLEDSAEGVITFERPSRLVHGVRLAFRSGEVVEASATEREDLLLSALDTDDGSRRVGELGLGCNEGITQRLNNVLFDEKMARTVHVALGAGLPIVGGTNRSALHWDMIKEMGAGTRIECDGEVVQLDGVWHL